MTTLIDLTTNNHFSQIDIADMFHSTTNQAEHSRKKRIKKKALNCKQGDLAIVVKDDCEKANLGLIVRILSNEGMCSWQMWSTKSNEWLDKMQRLQTWRVQSVSARGISYVFMLSDTPCQSRVGNIPDEYLRPLRVVK